MYINGLNLDPEFEEAHKALREISMVRKARGGKPMGMWDRAKLKAAKDDFKGQMLNAEHLLAYDPGNIDHMLAMASAAAKGAFYDIVRWVGPIAHHALATNPKPDFNKVIALKEIYKTAMEFRTAADVCALALRVKPNDMNLQQELKDLATKETIQKGNYEKGDFRESIRNVDQQRELMQQDMDIRTEDAMAAGIRKAQAEYDVDPNDPGALKRLVDILRKTEQTEYENRAIELLDGHFKRTKSYPYRDIINTIKTAQLSRMERSLREQVMKNMADVGLRKSYEQFLREKAEELLRINTERLENYPSNNEARMEIGRQLFALGRFDDAIPVFQQARNDAKYRVTGSVMLGRAFLEAGFPEEAADTLQGVIADYAGVGDEKSIDMTYWYARSLEERGDIPSALKSYSQVFQWNAKYRDVQPRIKRLRAASRGTP